jgi:hypothetical protein
VTDRRRTEKRIQREVRRTIDARGDGVHVVANIVADVSAHVVTNRRGGGSSTEPGTSRESTSKEEEK